jgi:hypothetical protein
LSGFSARYRHSFGGKGLLFGGLDDFLRRLGLPLFQFGHGFLDLFFGRRLLINRLLRAFPFARGNHLLLLLLHASRLLLLLLLHPAHLLLLLLLSGKGQYTHHHDQGYYFFHGCLLWGRYPQAARPSDRPSEAGAVFFCP